MNRFDSYRENVLGYGYDFYKVRALQTAFELDIFEAIGLSTKTARTIADELKADAHSMEIFLDALVSLGLLDAQGRGYKNTKFGGDIFLKGKSFYIGDMVRLQRRMSANWFQLEQALRSGKPITQPEFFKVEDPEASKAFTKAMHNTAVGHAGYLAKKINLEGAGRLLDIGCGSGAFSIAFLKEFPSLKVTLFDLPIAIEVAREYVEKAGLLDRVQFIAGNFLEEPLPSGFDICFISHVIHGLGEAANRQLLTKVFSATNRTGRVIIQDFFLNANKKSPQFPALFSLNMLLHTNGGRCYSYEEVNQWLEETGFKKPIRPVLRLPRSIGLLISEKP